MRKTPLLMVLVASLSLVVSTTTGVAALTPDCPTPRAPYDLSPACARAISDAARPPDDPEACTTETIAGAYGFRTTGVSIRADGTTVEFASFGRMVRDGHGNVVSGMVTSNTGGTVTRASLTGTYTVNSDCTGSQTSNLSSGAVVHFDFVIVDKGQRMEFILIEPTSTIGGTQTRQ